MTRKEKEADRQAILGEKLYKHESELLAFVKEWVCEAFRSTRERYEVAYNNVGFERRPNIEIDIKPMGCKHRLEDYETVKVFLDECNGNRRASYESGFGFYPEDYGDELRAELEARVYPWLRSQYQSELDDEDKDYLNESNDLTDLVVQTISSLMEKIQKMDLAALFVTQREEIHERIGYDS